MINSIFTILGYVLSRVLFVVVMAGLPTAALFVPKVFQGLSEKKQELLAVRILYGYAIVLTGIILAIVLKKAGL